jgi:hypothetical protein
MTDPQLRAFLLRRLPAAETARLEDSIVTEDGVAERLRDEEFDLLDDYAAGVMNAEDRGAVERHLLNTPQSLHSLKVARALRRQGAAVGSAELAPADRPTTVSRVGGQAAGWSRFRTRRAAGVATLLAAGIASLALIPVWRQGPDGRDPRTGTLGLPGNTAAVAPAPAPRLGDAPTGSLPVITLVADVERGALRPPPRVKIAAGTTSVQLQAEVPDAEPGVLYSLRVDDAAGRRLFEGSELAVRVAGRYQFVEAVVPVAALAPGARTISLRASSAAREAPAKFSWRITGLVE